MLFSYALSPFSLILLLAVAVHARPTPEDLTNPPPTTTTAAGQGQGGGDGSGAKKNWQNGINAAIKGTQSPITDVPVPPAVAPSPLADFIMDIYAKNKLGVIPPSCAARRHMGVLSCNQPSILSDAEILAGLKQLRDSKMPAFENLEENTERPGAKTFQFGDCAKVGGPSRTPSAGTIITMLNGGQGCVHVVLTRPPPAVQKAAENMKKAEIAIAAGANPGAAPAAQTTAPAGGTANPANPANPPATGATTTPAAGATNGGQ